MKTEIIKKKFYILVYPGSLTQYVKVLQKLQENNPDLRWKGTWLKPLDYIPALSSENDKRNILVIDRENNELGHMVCDTDASGTILRKIKTDYSPSYTTYDVLSPSFQYPTEEKELQPVSMFFIYGHFPAIPVYDQDEYKAVYNHMKYDLHAEYKAGGFELLDISCPRKLIFCEFPVTSESDREYIAEVLEKTKRRIMDAKSFIEKVHRIYISKNEKVEDLNNSKDFVVPVKGPADEMQLIRLTDALGIRWLNPKKKPFDPEKLEDGNYYRHIYMNDDGDWLCRLRYHSETKNPNKLVANSTVYYIDTLYNNADLNFGTVTQRISAYNISEFGVRCNRDSDVYRVLNKFLRWTEVDFFSGDHLNSDCILGYLPSWNGGKSTLLQVRREVGYSMKTMSIYAASSHILAIDCTDFLDTEFDFHHPLKGKGIEVKSEVGHCYDALRKILENRDTFCMQMHILCDGEDEMRNTIKKAEELGFKPTYLSCDWSHSGHRDLYIKVWCHVFSDGSRAFNASDYRDIPAGCTVPMFDYTAFMDAANQILSEKKDNSQCQGGFVYPVDKTRPNKATDMDITRMFPDEKEAEGPTVRDILGSTVKVIGRNGKTYDLGEVKSLELNTVSPNATQEMTLNLNTEAISGEVLAHILRESQTQTQKKLHKVINSVYGCGVYKTDSLIALTNLLSMRPFRDVLDMATNSAKEVMIRNKIMDIILGKSQELYISYETENEAQAVMMKLEKIFKGDETYIPNNRRADTNKLVRLTRRADPGNIYATAWDDPSDGNEHLPYELPGDYSPIPENWRKDSITAKEFLHANVVKVYEFWKSLHDKSKKTHFEGHKEDVTYILEHIPANGTVYNHQWLSEACMWYGNNFVTCEELLSMNDVPYHKDTVAALVKYLRYRNKLEENE